MPIYLNVITPDHIDDDLTSEQILYKTWVESEDRRYKKWVTSGDYLTTHHTRESFTDYQDRVLSIKGEQ